MDEHRTIGVGVIGLGFMGRTHLLAYDAARRAGYPCRVLAVCDHGVVEKTLRSGPRGSLDSEHAARAAAVLAGARRYAEVEALLEHPQIDLVSICTYTDTHVDLALRCLERGKHVLVEKPVALRSQDVQRLADGVRPGRLCMPAMCMRFWPAWAWLLEHVRGGTFGAVRSATFERLGSRPDWATHFYADERRSGGALVDLHIHDADFVCACFGPPRSVFATGTTDHLTAAYLYTSGREAHTPPIGDISAASPERAASDRRVGRPDPNLEREQGGPPPHVVAEGGWDHAPGWAFRVRYVVVFENATADFDISRDPQLMLIRDGRCEPVPLPRLTGYDAEVRHLLESISRGASEPAVTVADAVRVTRLLEAERRSLETGAVVRLDAGGEAPGPGPGQR